MVDLFCWLAVEQKPGSTPFAAALGIWDRTFMCMYACGAPGTEACACGETCSWGVVVAMGPFAVVVVVVDGSVT